MEVQMTVKAWEKLAVHKGDFTHILILNDKNVIQGEIIMTNEMAEKLKHDL